MKKQIYIHVNAKDNLITHVRNTPVVNWSRFPHPFRGLLNQRAYISADVTSVKKWRYSDNPQAACSPTHNGTHRWKLTTSQPTTYDLLQPARNLLGSLSSINLFSSWILEEGGGEMLGRVDVGSGWGVFGSPFAVLRRQWSECKQGDPE